MTTDDVTVPPPPAVPGELIEKAAAWLRSTHWDGNGCGTHGTNACSRCYGPSPADAREVAEDVLESVYGGIVEAARRDALTAAAEAIRVDAHKVEGMRRAARIVTDLAERPAAALSATVSDRRGENAPAPVRDAEGPQIALQGRGDE